MIRIPMSRAASLTFAALACTACQVESAPGTPTKAKAEPTAIARQVEPTRPARTDPPRVDWPDTLYVFGNGYPNAGDPCRQIGESDVVRNYLDHNERLLGCPTEADAVTLVNSQEGQIVGTEGPITLVSVRTPGP